jgi:putative nucleotidyltransferase with HDIG domain
MNIVEKSTEFAKIEYQKNNSKHQWAHVEEVMNRALEIASKIKDVDYELLKLGVIFHDIDYNSEPSEKDNYEKHVDNSVKVAEEFLIKNNYSKEKIKLVKKIMIDHSRPHREKLGESTTTEGKILFDADKSIFLKTKDAYDRYFPLLYFEETKKMVKIPKK